MFVVVVVVVYVNNHNVVVVVAAVCFVPNHPVVLGPGFEETAPRVPPLLSSPLLSSPLFKRLETGFKTLETGFKRLETCLKRLGTRFTRLDTGFKRSACYGRLWGPKEAKRLETGFLRPVDRLKGSPRWLVDRLTG